MGAHRTTVAWLLTLAFTVAAGAGSGPLAAAAVAAIGATGALWLLYGQGAAAPAATTGATGAATELLATARTLSDLADQIVAGARLQSVRVRETATALEAIATSADEVARYAQQAAESEEATVGSAEEGWTRVREAIDSNERLATSFEHAAGVMQQLDDAQTRIAGVLGVIREVANTTNLLSLNATIEAARAGAHGRGFAVVAAEVRTLAQRAADAANEVGEIMSGIAGDIGTAVESMQAVRREVQATVASVTDAERRFEHIRERVGASRTMIRRIAEAATAQSSTTGQAAQTMDGVAVSAVTSTQQAERVSQASQTLWVLADDLNARRRVHQTRQGWRRQLVLHLGTVHEPDYPSTQALGRLGDLLEAHSRGRIRTERHFGAAQGIGDREILSRLRDGQWAFGITTSAVASNYAPALQVLDLPYAFVRTADGNAILEGPLGRRLMEPLAAAGLVGLGYFTLGLRHFTNSRHAVRHPDDLRGFVIRTVESNVFKALCHAVGATPRQVGFDSMLEALRTRSVDAQENSLMVVFRREIYRHQRHLTLDGHSLGAFLLLGSASVLKALPDDMRRVVDEAVRELGPWQRAQAARLDQETLAALERQGMEIERLTAGERQAFVEATQTVWDQFRAVIGEDVMHAFEQAVGRPAPRPGSRPAPAAAH